MHPNNCFNCKKGFIVPVPAWWANNNIHPTQVQFECRYKQDKSVKTIPEVMNFISVLGCASFESNTEKP